jgi:hypothetical protein
VRAIQNTIDRAAHVIQVLSRMVLPQCGPDPDGLGRDVGREGALYLYQCFLSLPVVLLGCFQFPTQFISHFWENWEHFHFSKSFPTKLESASRSTSIRGQSMGISWTGVPLFLKMKNALNYFTCKQELPLRSLCIHLEISDFSQNPLKVIFIISALHQRIFYIFSNNDPFHKL